MKYVNSIDFRECNWADAKRKNSNIKTYPTSFLIVCLAQASTDPFVGSDVDFYEICDEIDRRFKHTQKEI